MPRLRPPGVRGRSTSDRGASLVEVEPLLDLACRRLRSKMKSWLCVRTFSNDFICCSSSLASAAGDGKEKNAPCPPLETTPIERQ